MFFLYSRSGNNQFSNFPYISGFSREIHICECGQVLGRRFRLNTKIEGLSNKRIFFLSGSGRYGGNTSPPPSTTANYYGVAPI